MTQTSKLLIVGISCFLLGAAALFSWTTYQKTQEENSQLKAQLETTANTTVAPSKPDDKAIVALSPIPDTQNNEKSPISQVGAITGTLGYPSEGIPPLEIVAFKENDHSVFFKTMTQANQQSFTIDAITPGVYVVVAYTTGIAGLSGGYTKAVACGLSVECTDHSLIQVEVTAGQTESGVAIKDWYAPLDQFPTKP